MKPKCEITSHRCDDDENDCAEANPVIFGHEDPSKNLLKNWGFESDISDSDWVVSKASARKSPDAHTGKWSLCITSKDQKHGQALQRVHNLKKNTNYYYSFFIKFISQLEEGAYFHATVMAVMKNKKNKAVKKERVARMNFQMIPEPGVHNIWQHVGGDFKTPNTQIEYVETRIEIDPVDVEFLLDTASLTELTPDPHWKKSTDEQIDKHRKSNITLNVNLPKGADPNEYVIRVNQTKREFGIGSAIQADPFNQEDDFGQAYRDCFFKHFEWAVFTNDCKWKPMERKKGQIRFERVDKALEKLHARGITVRGHAVHWNNKKNNPEWVREKTGHELQAEIDRRLEYVVDHFKGKFVQWDVCNEHLQKRFFEENTCNYHQIKHLFEKCHEIDPGVHLYLNDYLVFRGGLLTSAIYNLARQLLQENIPLHGIGVQSHLKHIPMDFEVLKKRVEIVSAADLPVMVTELSVHNDDVSVRAEFLDKVLRLYFSSPKIIGVVFWGFSDIPGMCMDIDAGIFEGPTFQPNEVGLVLQKLLKEWRTNMTFCSREHSFEESFRAFHGNYELEVLRKGVKLTEEPFIFKVEKDWDVDIKLDF